MDENIGSVVQSGLSVWYESSFKKADIPKELSVAFELSTPQLSEFRDSLGLSSKGSCRV